MDGDSSVVQDAGAVAVVSDVTPDGNRPLPQVGERYVLRYIRVGSQGDAIRCFRDDS